MKRENTSLRLKRIMYERSLRQVDILELAKPFCQEYDVKMNKSDLSQYVSGKVEPSQDKLVILGMALNVNEAWLMGFDVPMEKESENNASALSKIAPYYNKLNTLGKEIATEQVRLLTLDEKYTRPDEPPIPAPSMEEMEARTRQYAPFEMPEGSMPDLIRRINSNKAKDA